MARRPASESTKAEEAPVSTTTEETPEVTEEKKKVETPVDLTAFNEAVKVAVENADESTGTVAEADTAKVQEAYRALPDVKAKNTAKRELQEQVKAAVNELNIVKGKALMTLADSLTSAGGGKAHEPKPPADPTQAYVERVTALKLAQTLVPTEGVNENWAEKANALYAEALTQVPVYQAFLADEAEDKTEPEGILPVVKAAVKLSTGKAAGFRKASTGSTGDGVRRDIGAHIREAFAGEESGTFLKIAQIRNHKSTEYGDDLPSAGAISARLFPHSGKCTVEGITPGTDKDGNRGATKN